MMKRIGTYSPVLFFLPFLSLLAALFMAMENEKKNI